MQVFIKIFIFRSYLVIQLIFLLPPDWYAARSINDGDMVLVYNARGQVKIPAKITDRVAKGVTTLSQGTWYTPDENGVDTRGSINVLTSQRPTPFARGNGQHTNLVEVKKLTV